MHIRELYPDVIVKLSQYLELYKKACIFAVCR